MIINFLNTPLENIHKYLFSKLFLQLKASVTSTQTEHELKRVMKYIILLLLFFFLQIN